MKYSFFSFLLISSLFLLSCNNESSIFDDDNSLKSELREGDVMSKKDCFEFVFPIGIVLPDGKVKKVSDEEAFYAIIKKWYKTNPDEKEKPGLKYPVEVIFKGEFTKTISNEKDMISLKKYCDGKNEEFEKDCFKLIYPISYAMPDATLISGENEKDLNAEIKAWYKTNSESKEKPSLVYPVDVILKDGSTTTINSEAAMIVLKKDC